MNQAIGDFCASRAIQHNVHWVHWILLLMKVVTTFASDLMVYSALALEVGGHPIIPIH